MEISNTLLAILLSLVPMFGFGISNVLQKVAVRDIGTESLIFFRGIIVTLIIFGLVLFTLDQAIFDWYWILIAGLVSFVSYFGLYFLNKGLEVGEAGIVVPFSSIRVIISSVIGILFLGDQVKSSQILFIGVIFIGIVIGSINFRKLKESNLLDMKSGIPYAIMAALFWGVTFPFFGIFGASLGTLFFSLLLELIVTVVSSIQIFMKNKKFDVRMPKSTTMWISVIAIGVVGALASIFQNLAYGTGQISIATAISSASPAVTVILGFIFLKERLTSKQYLGVSLIIVGILGLVLV